MEETRWDIRRSEAETARTAYDDGRLQAQLRVIAKWEESEPVGVCEATGRKSGLSGDADHASLNLPDSKAGHQVSQTWPALVAGLFH